ncbi:DUF305 domain-containing protein [Agromyces cerinus]|uniref:Uncharacterized conserved protein, DUF305 family n=1 Tax=Agromyces cerinus subsp. cerinus TaxID=232089 RepID=A0A1N6ICM0_9MICO|nr:DUF305 domain-containing protein [Agromyces cerinus]SIO29788.1 Uncharacterized conserved protein, DUF305 family [Agromyces cerinus subsp. cerinus]
MTRDPERSTADIVTDAGDPTDPVDPPVPAAPRQRRGGRAAVIAVASVALIVVAAVAFSIGRLSTLAEPTPTTTSAEAGFSRDMQVHHLQGVELAMIVRDATDDPEVRLLGYDIATTQAQQAGQMYGWLAEWGLPQAGSEPSMTWMTRPALDGAAGHGDHAASDPDAHVPGAPMPGLATPAQVEELRGMTGIEAERRFLELMIAHHQGAVEMADAALARSTDDVVTALAQSIVDSQTSEIELMTGMLAERTP